MYTALCFLSIHRSMVSLRERETEGGKKGERKGDERRMEGEKERREEGRELRRLYVFMLILSQIQKL